MSDSIEAAGNLADRIREKLGTIHRGAIWIGPKTLAVFGNDGYAADMGTRNIVERMRGWLVWRGYASPEVQVCSEGYSWAIVVECYGKESEWTKADAQIWRIWGRTPNHGRTAPHAGNWQRAAAAKEIENIGYGYTDATLETPREGKGGPVRGDLLLNDILLAKADGGEAVHVLLGGVPFPAKVLPTSAAPQLGISDGMGGITAAEPPPWLSQLEVVVATESIGDPREEGHGTATGFVPAGASIFVRDFGEKHVGTGRRVLVPINPTTGEPLAD